MLFHLGEIRNIGLGDFCASGRRATVILAGKSLALFDEFPSVSPGNADIET